MKRWRKCVRRWLLFMLSVVVIVGGCLKITEAPPHQPEATSPIQGVWLTHVGTAFYASTGQLDNIFHQLSRLNFNHVYVCVYNNGVTYPSQVGYRNPETHIPLLNPLNLALHQAKRQGLKIYAWFEYGLALSPTELLARSHPEWLLNQGQVVDGFVWLNPSHPDVQQYLLELFTEFAYLYHKLEGIQLDDHWAVPTVFGNQAAALTQLTATLTTTLKQINPHWIISLSPHIPDFAYRNYSQDWLSWVRQGYVDEVIVQIYRPTTQAVAQTLTHSGLAEASRYVPVAVGLYTGFTNSTLTLTPLSEVAQQIQWVQRQGYGYSLFTFDILPPLKQGDS